MASWSCPSVAVWAAPSPPTWRSVSRTSKDHTPWRSRADAAGPCATRQLRPSKRGGDAGVCVPGKMRVRSVPCASPQPGGLLSWHGPGRASYRPRWYSPCQYGLNGAVSRWAYNTRATRRFAALSFGNRAPTHCWGGPSAPDAGQQIASALCLAPWGTCHGPGSDYGRSSCTRSACSTVGRSRGLSAPT